MASHCAAYSSSLVTRASWAAAVLGTGSGSGPGVDELDDAASRAELHSTGLLRSTPRGSNSTMSKRASSSGVSTLSSAGRSFDPGPSRAAGVDDEGPDALGRVGGAVHAPARSGSCPAGVGRSRGARPRAALQGAARRPLHRGDRRFRGRVVVVVVVAVVGVLAVAVRRGSTWRGLDDRVAPRRPAAGPHAPSSRPARQPPRHRARHDRTAGTGGDLLHRPTGARRHCDTTGRRFRGSPRRGRIGACPSCPRSRLSPASSPSASRAGACERCELGAIAALKTVDPPLSSLVGRDAPRR